MLRTQSRDFGWKQCSARGRSPLPVAGKSLNRFQPTLVERGSTTKPDPKVTACLVCDRGSLKSVGLSTEQGKQLALAVSSLVPPEESAKIRMLIGISLEKQQYPPG
jgi:hypothetical protein